MWQNAGQITMPDADDFGSVTRTFTTSAGERVSKIQTKQGGTLYYSEQEGQLNQQEFSAKSAQRREVRQFAGKEQEETLEEIDVNDLSERYQAEQTYPISGIEPGTVGREQIKQQNMFVGFLLQDDTPDDRVKAAMEYEEMTKRLREANTDEKERKIKDEYNIGGS